MTTTEETPRIWVTALIDSLLIFVFAAALIFPLFRVKYLDHWESIESTFISDGRFLKEHWPHPQWQPLWYGGTRFDYIYPPALRYGVAALSKAYPMLPARAYHIYIAFFYCLGIAGVYVLIRTMSRSRAAAWLGAAAAALVSPCFLFMAHIRAGGLHIAPWRLTVLVVYGEGPHMSALALLPFALAASWVALQKARPAMIALAALLCALVVSHNFYGATALTIFFPILCWSLWITHQDRRMWFRALGIAGLAYGLTAFWLVPSYLWVTTANLRIVSAPGNLWSLWIALGVAVAFVLATDRLVRWRRELAYPVFVVGAFLFFTLNVLGQHYFNFRVLGEPERLAPEFDLAAILISIEGLRRLWAHGTARRGRESPQHPTWRGLSAGHGGIRAAIAFDAGTDAGVAGQRPAPRKERAVFSSTGIPACILKARPWLPKALAVLLVLAAFGASRHYLRKAWQLYRREPNFQQRVEYRIPEWIAKNLPGARSLVTGSVRFWYNAWHDGAQIGGGSEQGVRNPIIIRAFWENMLGPAAEPSVLWMQCLGVDAVVVHDKSSQEHYHDFQHPKKFAGVLPVLFDDQQGNVIYKVPRRFPGLARVVDGARAAALKPHTLEQEQELIRAYAGLLESGPDSPAVSSWEGTDALRIRTRLKPGESLAVLASYDPAWHAYSRGSPLPVRKDALGQMLIEAPPGEHDLRLVFETPLENRIGRILSIVSALLLVVLVAKRVRA